MRWVALGGWLGAGVFRANANFGSVQCDGDAKASQVGADGWWVGVKQPRKLDRSRAEWGGKIV